MSLLLSNPVEFRSVQVSGEQDLSHSLLAVSTCFHDEAVDLYGWLNYVCVLISCLLCYEMQG